MKKFLMYLGVAAFLALPAQGAFAFEVGDLNPLPYVGIGPNYTKFSLNPFTGFKNCNPCKRVEKCKCPKVDKCKKVKKDKCNKCAQVEQPKCTACQRAFDE